ncbi:hypothetical protein [Solidesulfovibrio sp. C21]
MIVAAIVSGVEVRSASCRRADCGNKKDTTDLTDSHSHRIIPTR